MLTREPVILQGVHCAGCPLQLRWPSGKSVDLWSCKLEFDSESGQTNDFKIGVKGQCGDHAGKFTFCPVGKRPLAGCWCINVRVSRQVTGNSSGYSTLISFS